MSETVTDQAGPAPSAPPGKSEFVPALAVFHCRWCEPEPEHVKGMLPPEVAGRSVVARLNCSARMEAEFAIKAFGEGFDGVLVIGCETGECHFRTGNEQAARRLGLLRKIFELAGIYPERLGIVWASPFDEDTTARAIEAYIDGLRLLGPFKER